VKTIVKKDDLAGVGKKIIKKYEEKQ